MTQADRVYNTPPTNTSAIDHPICSRTRSYSAAFPRRGRRRQRRRAGSLAAARWPEPRRSAVLSDPAFGLIADKQAADIRPWRSNRRREAEEHGIG